MKTIKSKKAMILYYVVFIGILVSFAAFFISYFGKPTAYLQFEGAIQLSFINASQEAEKQMLYNDIAAKQAAAKTSYELALNGGYFGASECGQIKGLNIWSSKYVPDYKNNFLRLMLDNLDTILGTKDELLRGRYLLSVIDNSLVGTSKSSSTVFKTEVFKKEGSPDTIRYEYAVNPSFKVDGLTVIAELNDIKEFLQFANCNGRTDTTNCLSRAWDKWPKRESYSPMFAEVQDYKSEIEIKSKKSTLILKEGRLYYEPLTYKLAYSAE
jgi:hypothetical protein